MLRGVTLNYDSGGRGSTLILVVFGVLGVSIMAAVQLSLGGAKAGVKIDLMIFLNFWNV